MQSSSSELQAFVAPLLALCERAGALICRHYDAPGAARFEQKGDRSPVTKADIDSHEVLLEGLTALTPAVPVLSEESAVEVHTERLGWSRYWLVDPLDGTLEFLNRSGDFSINIALVEHQRPTLGVLYLPLENRAYVGVPGTGCWRYEGGERVAQLRTRRLDCDHLTVLGGRSHRQPELLECLEWLAKQCGELARIGSGGAIKFCQLVEGEGDLYPRFARCCEWDTGAGQAVLEAAGGAVWGRDGAPLRYNSSATLYSPPFYAIADPDDPLWQAMLTR